MGGAFGRGLLQFARQGFVDFASRKLAGRAQADLEQRLVGRAELFDQQRNARLISGKDRAARRFQNSLSGNIGFADFVVDRHGFG